MYMYGGPEKQCISSLEAKSQPKNGTRIKMYSTLGIIVFN